jgi:protoheme IX farnesyltransferase
MRTPIEIAASAGRARRIALAREYFELTKPRVVALILFTAVVGMFLAVPAAPPLVPFLAAVAGIGLMAAAAAAVNHVVDKHADGMMARTKSRPLPAGSLSARQALVFAAALGALGLAVLVLWVNALTAALTFASLIGYSVIYTLYLKQATPQNIVIGGAAGAAPPVLGWAAVTGGVSGDALLLFLIIFAWTPPHFWALALYRQNEYAKVGIPMLPVTHGGEFTRLHILLYTIVLAAVTIMPYATRLSGGFYLIGALALNALFVHHAWRLYRRYSDSQARRTFFFSIRYLAALFALLLVDHYRFYFMEALQSALY